MERPAHLDHLAQPALLAREESKVPQVPLASRVCLGLPAPLVRVASLVTRVFPERLGSLDRPAPEESVASLVSVALLGLRDSREAVDFLVLLALMGPRAPPVLQAHLGLRDHLACRACLGSAAQLVLLVPRETEVTPERKDRKVLLGRMVHEA